MRILILEDDPERVRHFKSGLISHTVFHTDSTKICISKLKDEQWDVLFLDHDLGGKTLVASGKNTGYEVAKWLESNPKFKPPQIIIHSLNGVGAKNMQMAVPEAVHAPFIWLELNK